MRKLIISIIILLYYLSAFSQTNGYQVKVKYNVCRTLLDYKPTAETMVSPVKTIEPLSSNAELLLGYRLSNIFALNMSIGFQQFRLGFYDVQKYPVNASAGVSGGRGAHIGYLKTIGLNIETKIVSYKAFSLETFIQPMIGFPKFNPYGTSDTSGNKFYWGEPGTHYIWKIQHPSYTNNKINKLLRFGLDLTYSRNDKIFYSLGSAYQIGSQIFFRDSTSIQIPSLNVKEMYTASIDGKSIFFTFAMKYRFNFRRPD